MKGFHKNIERRFEKFTEGFIRVYGHPFTFVAALVVVLVYLINPRFYKQDFHECIRDLISSVTFLSFFIIQKVFNKNSTVTQIKINELLASNEKASTRLVNIEEKTEQELKEVASLYTHLSEKAKTTGNTHASASIDTIGEITKEDTAE
jgi:low affinity Fe/Cu permease